MVTNLDCLTWIHPADNEYCTAMSGPSLSQDLLRPEAAMSFFPLVQSRSLRVLIP